MPVMMMRLADLVASHEDWLMQKVLTYAKEMGYTRYTSTLAEAWRTSISGLSQPFLECLKNLSSVPELLPDEDNTPDPIASFGIIEAKRHRRRGVSLSMFLGLMKYYRQSYIDLVVQNGFGIEEERLYRLFIDRFFDRIEIGFCTEWNSLTENQMLEELQSSNRCMTNEKNKYLTIFESIKDPAFLLDKDNLIENVNHAASELLYGISVPGSTYYDNQKTRESFPWIADELAALDASGQMEVVFERQIITGKGILQFQVKIKQMLDVSEKFSGKVVILNDITECKRTEEALRESEQRLSDIIDFLPDATFAVDREGKVIAWNRALEEMTCVLKSEMVGKDNYAYAIPFYSERRAILIDLIFMDRKEIEEKYYFILRKGDQLIAETFIPMLNGRKDVFLWGIASPLYDSGGSVVGAIESIRDISRYKQTEEDLKKTNLQLETATKHAEQMARQAEQANAAKSEFLANMSHEIRTPMNAVIGMTDLLQYENLNPRQKDCVEIIRNSGEALLAIINNILNLPKIEGGMMELEHQPFALQSVIVESLQLIRPIASEKDLCTAYDIDKKYSRGDFR